MGPKWRIFVNMMKCLDNKRTLFTVQNRRFEEETTTLTNFLHTKDVHKH